VNHSYTGDIKVRDDERKTHYPKIQDKYNQIKELAILIKDVDLVLSNYLPELRI
jgi:hypothetical protein